MDDLTIIYSIFNPPPGLIVEYINYWRFYPKCIKMILIDDCSNESVKFNINFPFNLKIARITTDRGFNSGGAKNLGFYLSDTKWVLQTDMDHMILPETAKSIISFNPKHDTVYRFKRKYIKKNGDIEISPCHSNSYIIERCLFWRLGGFDEDLSGSYGSEDSLMSWVMNKKKIQQKIIDHHLIMKELYSSNIRKNKRHNRNVKNQKMNDPDYKNGPIMRFNWEITQEFTC